MARPDQVLNYRPAIEHALAFSQVVKSGPFLFISGILSMDREGNCIGAGNMALQVQTVYSQLREILAEQDVAFEQVVRETIYTVNMQALCAAAPLRARFFESFRGPASTWVEVQGLYRPEYLLEVEVIAERSRFPR
jgi:enamine deaminase RidA (YjgF/YER057c/UK114 family)